MENNFNVNGISVEQDMANTAINKPTLAQVSILYSAAVLLLLYVGFRVQRHSVLPGLLITELGLVLTPSLGLLFIYRYDIKRVLRINRAGLLNLFLVFCIMIFALPIVGVLNMVNFYVINSIFGKVIIPEIPNAANSSELIRNVLIIAGSAAICEEVMFRGVIQRGLERLGTVKAILITAFLFGLLHLDFQRFLGTFLLGALIGFIVYRSNSLFSGMFAHFCNNSFAVILAYAAGKITQFSKSSGFGKVNDNASKLLSNLSSMTREQLIGVAVGWGFIFMVCTAVMVGLIIAFIVTTSGKVEKAGREAAAYKKTGLLWLAPGLVFISLMYLAEGLKLRSATSALAESIIRFIGLK